jgi:hypothetical protein
VKHTIWTGVLTAAIGLATATALIAQAPQSEQQPTQTDTKLVVTGCLRAAPPNTAGTSGAAGNPGVAGAATPTPGAAATTGTAEQKFELAEATTASASSAAAAPADAASAGAGKKTYQLIANPTALAPHIGKKLEMTGTIDASNTTPGTTALRVESGKIVADTCGD